MKQIPLYEQIYEEIREKIEERGYRVGDRLPSEKELSEQYHVSRITSKKAVELLAEEGLVTRIPGKGTFVIEHQEMPKALEIPADSMTEKKPLPDHPPVIGVVLDGWSREKTNAFLEALSIFSLGYSWGGFESLAIPARLNRTATQWEAAGPLIRLHVGLEDTEDLIADLDAAFARVGNLA